MRNLLFLLISFLLFACNKPAEVKAGPQFLACFVDTINYELLDSNDNIYLYFSVENLTITDSSLIAVNINRQVNKSLVANNVSFNAEINSYQELFDSTKAEYLRLKKSALPPQQAWEISQAITLSLNQNGLFAYQSEHRTFTGGAHANTFYASQLFRLRDGALLNLDSLLITEEKLRFSEYAEALFRQKYNLSESNDLNATGFWFEHNNFSLPQVFTYNHEGLLLLYNPYEIGPYTMGPITVLIPYPSLLPFLKPNYHLSTDPIAQPLAGS
jgi:hypothetical protein